MFARLALVASLGFLLPTFAQATSLTAQDVFSQFNLVVLQNMTSSSDVEGRTYVGGNASGGNYAIHNGQMPASSYAGITTGGSLSNANVQGGIAVGGNASSVNVNSGGGVVMGNASNSNFNGNVPSYVAGTSSGVNTNSGKASSPASNATLSGYSDGLGSANTADIATVLGDASKSIAALTANSTATITGGNTLNFNATPIDGVAVFDIDSFDGITQAIFNLGSATSIFINSSVETASLNINFLGGAAAAIGSKVIWNFYDATSLIFNSQWGGSVLAPDAAVTTNANIEGTLVAMSLTQHGEMHLQTFTGTLPASLQPVPVPASFISFASGLALLCGLWMMRRRSSSPASGMSHAAA